MAFAAVFQGIGGDGGQREGPVDVPFLLRIGFHGISGDLGVGGIGSGQQGLYGEAVPGALLHRDHLGQGQQDIVSSLLEGRGDGVALQIGQQIEGAAQGVVGGVALNDNAIVGSHAVFPHQGFQVGQVLPVLGGVGENNEVPAGVQVGLDGLRLVLRQVAVWAVDQQAVGVLRDALFREQGEVCHLDVLLLHRRLEGGGQIVLPVAGKGV